ncbi:MAG: adenylate/guanylate cyclase domain-containing protein [Candidatus Kapaibacterium sp.]
MKKTLLFSLLAALFTSLCVMSAQNIDSLYTITRNLGEDTAKVYALIRLSELSSKKADYQRAGLYAQEALILSEKLHFKAGQAAAYKSIGLSAMYKLQGASDKKEELGKMEQRMRETIAQKEIEKQKLVRDVSIAGLALVLLFSALLYNRFRLITRQKIIIETEKKRSEELLLNILPVDVAEELKTKGKAAAKQFNEVTVMFTDFKGFTQISEKLTPDELVAEIDTCFKAFDAIVDKYHIEKIKTMGDSYMCVGGLPRPNADHARSVVQAAIEIREYMDRHNAERLKANTVVFDMRIGIHSGSVVAGIVGAKKFAYDIWGDTVNIASRMESSGEEGKINISGATYELVKNHVICTPRGKVHAKNKGEIDMYFVEGLV